MRHGQHIDSRFARQPRRCDDHRAGSIFATLVLANIKLSAPQKGVPQDKAGRGLGKPHPNRREGRSDDRALMKPALH
jgi:hypothetical protein